MYDHTDILHLERRVMMPSASLLGRMASKMISTGRAFELFPASHVMEGHAYHEFICKRLKEECNARGAYNFSVTYWEFL
jgi:hypothetical protein